MSAVDKMLQKSHDKRQASAKAAGMAWCGTQSHPDRQPGKVCKRCMHQHTLWVAFWRSMGVRDPEREM